MRKCLTSGSTDTTNLNVTQVVTNLLDTCYNQVKTLSPCILSHLEKAVEKIREMGSKYNPAEYFSSKLGLKIKMENNSLSSGGSDHARSLDDVKSDDKLEWESESPVPSSQTPPPDFFRSVTDRQIRRVLQLESP